MTDRLSLPLRLDGRGRFVTVDTDGQQALTESVGLLLDTRPGDRRSVPAYGYSSPLFSQAGVDPTVVRGVIAHWEDTASHVEITTAMTANGVQDVTVELGVSDEEFA